MKTNRLAVVLFVTLFAFVAAAQEGPIPKQTAEKGGKPTPPPCPVGMIFHPDVPEADKVNPEKVKEWAKEKDANGVSKAYIGYVCPKPKGNLTQGQKDKLAADKEAERKRKEWQKQLEDAGFNAETYKADAPVIACAREGLIYNKTSGKCDPQPTVPDLGPDAAGVIACAREGLIYNKTSGKCDPQPVMPEFDPDMSQILACSRAGGVYNMSAVLPEDKCLAQPGPGASKEELEKYAAMQAAMLPIVNCSKEGGVYDKSDGSCNKLTVPEDGEDGIDGEGDFALVVGAGLGGFGGDIPNPIRLLNLNLGAIAELKKSTPDSPVELYALGRGNALFSNTEGYDFGWRADVGVGGPFGRVGSQVLGKFEAGFVLGGIGYDEQVRAKVFAGGVFGSIGVSIGKFNVMLTATGQVGQFNNGKPGTEKFGSIGIGAGYEVFRGGNKSSSGEKVAKVANK